MMWTVRPNLDMRVGVEISEPHFLHGGGFSLRTTFLTGRNKLVALSPDVIYRVARESQVLPVYQLRSTCSDFLAIG